nr:MAG TPA: hypothetical protein [Caudoviricetes sp.]
MWTILIIPLFLLVLLFYSAGLVIKFVLGAIAFLIALIIILLMIDINK